MSTPTPNNGLAFWSLALVCVTALAYLGFLSVNNHFLWYDDEGYMMISLQGVLEGRALYTDIYSQYGPFYYQLRELIFRVLGLQVDHDTNRMVALFGWMLTAATLAALVFRITRDRAASLFSFVFAFLFLEVVVKEPGHPQQTASLLLVCGLLLMTRRMDRWTLTALGATTAALTLTKINMGAFFFLSLAPVLFWTLKAERVRTWGMATSYALIVLLGASVVINNLTSGNLQVTLTVVLSASSVFLVLRAHPPDRTAPTTNIAAFATGAATVGALSIGQVLLRGTHISDLVWATFLQHTTLTGGARLDFPWYASVMAAAGLAVAIYVVRSPRDDRRAALNSAKVVYGTAVLALAIAAFVIESDVSLDFGTVLRGNAKLLWHLAPGFAWLLVVPGRVEAPGARAALAMTAVVSMLIAFPIAGSQITYSVILLTAVAILTLTDGVAAAAFSPDGRLGAARLCRVTLFAGLALALPLRVAMAHRSYHFQSSDPHLAGASRLRLPPAGAELYSTLARDMSRDCDTFMSINGVNSLYFWTGMRPPTGSNMTVWPNYFTADQQAAIIEVLDSVERPCVLNFEPYGYLRSRDLETERGLFGRYVLEEYTPSWVRGQYTLYTK